MKFGALGSPPRVRVKHFVALSADSVYGITPARAGKTVLHANKYHLKQDHPRACG